MLIQLVDGKPVGYPVSEDNFRLLFPNVSFPAPLTTDSVENTGFGIYEYSPKPQTGRYQKTVEITPVLTADVWYQTWQVVDCNDAEKKEIDDNKAAEVRYQRNFLLANCDWTQLPDAPVDHAEWAIYRQELRDVSSQPGFPWEITWPTKP